MGDLKSSEQHQAEIFSKSLKLEVQDLKVAFKSSEGYNQVVRGLSFTLKPGERLALVGESGSGKSTVFNSLLGLLPRTARFQGQAFLGTQDLLSASPKELAAIRGRRIAMVIQEPQQGFDPQKRVGSQIKEALLVHRMCSRRKAPAKVIELLEEVGLKEPDRVASSFVHQISGGMAQRAMLAMMLAAEPDILVADEVTSALDAPLRRAILELIDRERVRRGLSVVLISHDLPLVASFADRILVMYGGRVVEEIEGGLIHQAKHPYTRGLLACLPRADRAGQPLVVLRRDPAWLL
jgi:peptide/nickel transport system ATP-binding protein